MVDIDSIIINLYSKYFFDEFMISEVTKQNPSYIKQVIKQFVADNAFQMETINNNITFNKINDNEYINYFKKSIIIHPDYMFGLVLPNLYNIQNIPAIPAINSVMDFFFGESSKLYDNYKGSFRYNFLLEIENKKTKQTYDYLATFADTKHSTYVEFRKIEEGHPPENYRVYHDPFPEFPKDEMNKVDYGLNALVMETVLYFQQNNLYFRPYFNSIEYGNIIYGYMNKDFFCKQFYDGYNEDDYGYKVFCDKKEEYAELIKKEKEKTEDRCKHYDANLLNEMLKTVNECIKNLELNNMKI